MRVSGDGRDAMNLPERSHYPCWRVDGKRAFLYVSGEKVQRCKVRCVSRAGLLVETDTRLSEGLIVELALTRSYKPGLIKLVRRSAYVARASDSGAAVLYFVTRKLLT
jgi:hypothetical protein